MKKLFAALISILLVTSAHAQAFAPIPSDQAADYAAARAHAQVTVAKDIDAYLAQEHQRLQITPEQEDLWNAYAQTVRDGAQRMIDLPFDAWDDTLNKSPQGVAAFTALYNSMSDAQRKLLGNTVQR